MLTIPTLGYLLACLAFLALSGLLAASWRGRTEGGVLLAASLASVVWAAVAVFQSTETGIGSLGMHVSELIRNITWIIFLLVVVYKRQPDGSAFYIFRVFGPITVVVALTLIFLIIYVFYGSGSLLTDKVFDYLVLSYLALSLLGVLLVEQICRNTPRDFLWAIKYLCLGLGSLFIFDFYLYADALLLQQIDLNIWSARGYINTIVVPLIAISAARNPRWSVDVFVSRSFVFHSTTLIVAGAYLIAMALGGYYIRETGGEWGGIGQVVFFFAAIMVLLTVLFSGQLRARLKVFLSKHFFSYRYDYRDEWLRMIETLSSTHLDDSLKKSVIHALAQIVESSSGSLYVKNDNGTYYIASSWNMAGSTGDGPVDHAGLMSLLDEKQWVIDLDEYRHKPQSYSGVLLPQWLMNIPNAWLVVPLVLAGGLSQTSLQGFVILGKPRTVIQVDWEVRDLLKTVGRQCASYLALLIMNEKLISAKQFDAFNRLSAYIVHDLKNILAQLSLIVKNASRHADDPAFIQDMIATVENSAGKMSRLLAQLNQSRASENNYQYVDLNRVLNSVIQAHSVNSPVPQFTGGSSDLYIIANEDRLTAILGHLIQNAQDATADTGSITISVTSNNGWAVLEITDSGSGMTEEFVRTRLFRPFDTTKGNAGMGIGVYESREVIHELGGTLDVKSRVGEGTTIIIRLKIAQKSGNSTLYAQRRDAIN